MRVFEVLFIVAPNIEESDIETLVTQLSDVATNQGARIAKIDRMGRRRLAYPIGKFNDGHYVVFTLEGTGAEIAELERRVGQQLVRRHPDGYRLTEVGQALLPRAEAVAQAVEALEQQVETARREAVGVVRVTCPEPLVARLGASPLLERFHARYPGLRVEFVMSDRYLDLAKGEVDVA